MCNGVDHGFGNDFAWNFISYRRGRAIDPCSDFKVKFGHNEVNGTINNLEYGSLVYLVGRNRFCHLNPVEMGALDTGRSNEALGLLAEQQQRGVCKLATVKQVQVGQQFFRRGAFLDRETPGLPRGTNEAAHLPGIKVANRSLWISGCVEGKISNQILVVKQLHQG
ncbi:MAG TPA: hypothetical protein PLZ31_11675 [Myxococcota bacterium]|nr:hypothetical protein [Myxococcota bacterium]